MEKPNLLNMQSSLFSSDFSLLKNGEEAWIEVIQQMERVYAELVESQVALEAKNEELENAQGFIESVLGAMSDLLIICDNEGRVIQVNQAMAQLRGLEAQELIGLPLMDLVQAPNNETQKKFTENMSAGKELFDCEVQVYNAKGEAVPISINCSPRFDNRNRALGMVLIGRPIGELQKAYRDLDHAHKNFEQAQAHLVASEKMAALGRLVAGVAHELNNPISFVFGNMHAMKTYSKKINSFLTALDSSQTSKELHDLRQELGMDKIAKDIIPLVEGTLEGAERVSAIVQDLRRFSGNQSEPIEEFRLQPVLRTALTWVLRGARLQPKIIIACSDNLSLISKKGHLHQILVNLIQNSLDALVNTPNPQITLSATQEENGVQIVVEDNGFGIDAADIHQVFEPFYTTKPIGQGTGLGLYVSYRLADEAGGKLSVENFAKGACFTLSLPNTSPRAD